MKLPRILSWIISSNDIPHGQMAANGTLCNWAANPVRDGVIELSYSPASGHQPRLYDGQGDQIPWCQEGSDQHSRSGTTRTVKTAPLEAGKYVLIHEGADSTVVEYIVNPIGEIKVREIHGRERADLLLQLPPRAVPVA